MTPLSPIPHFPITNTVDLLSSVYVFFSMRDFPLSFEIMSLQLHEAFLVMEILCMTNKMRLIMIFIIKNALHVSAVYRPSSGAHELHMQPMVQVS
jgi:hypothetical protein